jgi:uncharacterized protein (TIGR03437 family)
MLPGSVAVAGTFGTVVPISGHGSDLALDEKRGLVYVANYTGNRVDVVSTATKTLQTSLNVAAQPASLALSPDGRYLVVTHYGNFQAPNTPSNAVTVLDLNSNLKQTFTFGSPPLGVAFGLDNLAFIATMQDFVLLDPSNGTTRVLETVAGVTAKLLPVPAGTFPPEIVRASLAASGDGLWVYGIAEMGAPDKALAFRYNVYSKQVAAVGWVASPPLGPRVTSVNQDGSLYLTGWGLFSRRGVLLAQFRNASGKFNIGSHTIDSSRGLVYLQFDEAVTESAPQSPPTAAAATPTLIVAEADNLAVRERLRLAENLAGKSLLSANGEVMYSISDSGLTVLPVGALSKAPRVASAQEDVVFRGNFCDRRMMTQEIEIVDPGGGRTDFSLVPSIGGIAVSPASGTTPQRVRVSINPTLFQNQKGTQAALIEIRSQGAVNLPSPVRVLINNKEPDQRGTIYNLPGKLVDLLADPARNRFYILRQDKNQVLVFDGATYKQIASLRTGNTPTQMALTLDRQYLLVGNDDSQLANVYDLDRLEQLDPVAFPPGHYPRSIASSGRAILAASRVAGPAHQIDVLDLYAHLAVTLPTLGIYENKINVNTVLAASPSGARVFVAQADGTVMLYDANGDTFVASRKDFKALSGAFAALSDERFVADVNLLNGSLVAVQQFESATGQSSGFALLDQNGLRTTAASAASPGVIQRVDLAQGSIRSTRMIEAPLLSEPATPGTAFRRTLAPLANRSAIIALTTSGFTVLSWNFDAAVADPRIERVVNAADRSEAVAPGGLIVVTGRDLSLVNAATREVPLPTALAESCLTVNGVLVPMILLSSTQINAQLPFNVAGNATMVLRTPAGVSNNYNFLIQAAAPSVFRSGVAGPDQDLPTLVRATNWELVTLSNPIHPEDWIVIYATGLGLTAPGVESGYPGPSDPLAEALIPPEVSLGGVALPIAYAGLVPGQVGVYQINAQVPYWVPLGMEVPLKITQGGSSTTLTVRVVK